ncbi:MAG: hypothetical protein AAAB14_16585, partial [Ensifer adhaerens]
MKGDQKGRLAVLVPAVFVYTVCDFDQTERAPRAEQSARNSQAPLPDETWECLPMRLPDGITDDLAF